MNNKDILLSLNSYKLAEFLNKFACNPCNYCNRFNTDKCQGNNGLCLLGQEEWLESEYAHTI